MQELKEMGMLARQAARMLATAGEAKKNAALEAIAAALEAHIPAILKANGMDVEAAAAAGTPQAMLDRLSLSEARIKGMADGVRDVMALTDPVGETVEGFRRPNGLRIQKVRVPMGVIGIIYEARPNVTSDAAALCLKAGNAVILRGGREAIRSNTAVAEAIREGLIQGGLPADAVQLVTDTSRETATAMMRMNGMIDVLIPRGGAGLIRSVVENATVPVIETGTGNCHVYVDKDADIAMAAAIAVNAKTSRPSVCNAAETLLVHQDIAPRALPVIAAGLREKNVTLRCCGRSAAILAGIPCEKAEEQDWETEYLDYIMAVRVVDSLEEAVADRKSVV